MSDETKNQHFLSQVEQRLNARNPKAEPANQKIFELEVIDRDAHVVRPKNARGRPIESNLKAIDLFSFDVGKDSRTRANFEKAFGHYEQRIFDRTTSLLGKHARQSSDCEAEVIDLFAAKILNFVRNPYSVAKVINTFGVVANHHPIDQRHYDTYLRIINGNKPHRDYICREYELTDDQYITWLRLLFLLLTPLQDGRTNILEAMIINLFSQREYEVCVAIHRYTNDTCLLCDRGFSSPAQAERSTHFDFNLQSDAFIRYSFFHYDELPLPMPNSIRAGLLLGPKIVHVQYGMNDLPHLDLFNRRVVEQCYRHVYCATKSPYGITVVGDIVR